MRFNILFIILLLFYSACSGSYHIVEKPTPYSTVIKKGKVSGVLFSKESECFLCPLGENRFTPTLTEIEEAEKIIKQKIKKVNNPLYNQGGTCPLIHNNLPNYRRQYFGYLDETNHKILFVSFEWDRYTLIDRLRGYYKSESDDWKTEYIQILDGCSYNWTIRVDLNTKQLHNLSVNGST